MTATAPVSERKATTRKATGTPPWLYPVAASFLAYFVLLVYCDFWGPQMTGMFTDFANARKTVRAVFPNSPAERAGLQPGDRVAAADGRAIRSLSDWTAIRVNMEVGRPLRLEIERGGERFETALVLERSSWRDWTSREGLILLAVRLAQLITLLLAFFIAFSRPRDTVALIGAWLLATVATTSFLLPYGMAATWRDLPAWLGGLLWIPWGNRLVLPPLLFTFFAVFPRQLFHSRRVWLLVWGPVAASLPFLIRNTYEMVYRPERVTGVPEWVAAITTIGVPAYIVGALIVLLVNYRRLQDANEKRRVRVLVAGSVAGWLGALLLFSYWWGPASRLAAAFYFSPALLLPVALFLLFPFSFAYAVVRHRVLEIPALLRRSARYVLVRRGFLLFILLLSAGATYAFINLYQRFTPSDSESALPLGIALGVALGMFLTWAGSQIARRVTERIDRLFFRSAYDARQILQDLAEKARTATNREELATLLARHLNEALRPRAMAVYLETGDGNLCRTNGHNPAGPEMISAEHPAMAALAHSAEIWEVPPAENGNAAVPELAALEPECLVPILGREGRLSGVVALGARLSEEHYSGEDKRLLASAASQVGVALENIRLAEEMADRLEAERRAAREMEIARKVQTRLFPQRMPALETLEYTGGCIQARAVGGDYYDFLDLGPGRMALVLADISGKGISAALLMANLQANLRSHYALALSDVSALLTTVNRLFYESTSPEHYATLFFA
ncbi:MAG TPA: SpoIIE family protein phosphatase, partial [Blastocatellia bacterium]|nr:SpoIIE family protein phosphatase [Blastocatellia bacterium]